MKKLASVVCFAFLGAFFCQSGSVYGQEKKELLQEKTVWSFVNLEPAKNWTEQFPLPDGGINSGEMSTEKRSGRRTCRMCG